MRYKKKRREFLRHLTAPLIVFVFVHRCYIPILSLLMDAAAGVTSACLGGGCALKSVTPRCGVPTRRRAGRCRWYRPPLLRHLGARSTAASTRSCACPREPFHARTKSSARPAKRCVVVFFKTSCSSFFFSFLLFCLFAYLPFCLLVFCRKGREESGGGGERGGRGHFLVRAASIRLWERMDDRLESRNVAARSAPFFLEDRRRYCSACWVCFVCFLIAGLCFLRMAGNVLDDGQGLTYLGA